MTIYVVFGLALPVQMVQMWHANDQLLIVTVIDGRSACQDLFLQSCSAFSLLVLCAQAITCAIEQDLERMEAGPSGKHNIQRSNLP